MSRMKKTIYCIFAAAAAGTAAFAWWAHRPILAADQPTIEFRITGADAGGSARQIAAAGVPVDAHLLGMLVRIMRKNGRLKPGYYELKAGATPLDLLDQMVRGAYLMQSVTIIEGWTFRQMRRAIDALPGVRHDTAALSDAALLKRIGSTFVTAEGAFFPDTYRVAKGSSDLQIYLLAHAVMIRRLNAEWTARDAGLPYKNAYDALVMASIVEKETGLKADRRKIAAVFVNRLRKDMPLQTDPAVIYGMGSKYNGTIRKRDLKTDTPYNTYTRSGLPPTPIALSGIESLHAALHPENFGALYFVARGDGSSAFSMTLAEHNRAVRKYLRAE
jgi:UPF0755 protein